MCYKQTVNLNSVLDDVNKYEIMSMLFMKVAKFYQFNQNHLFQLQNLSIFI